MRPPEIPAGPGRPDARPASTPSTRYDPTTSRRDLRLDLLRGLCLVKMIFNHLWHTPLHLVQGWLGFVSAAEGFFFISGAVVGIVHGRRVEERGLGAVSRDVLRRAGHLYLANLALVFLFLGLESGGVLADNRFARMWGPAGLHWSELLTLNQPYLLHVLPRYVVFLAVTPLALAGLARGRGAWVLAASGSLYLLAQALGGQPRLPWLESEGFLGFPVLTWQLLFFAGMLCGRHRQRLAAVWRRWSSPAFGVALGAGSLAFVLFARAAVSGWLAIPLPTLELLFDRNRLGPGRLVNLVVAFAFLFWLVDRYWRPIARSVGPLLLPLGQNSLYVFLVHIAVVVLAGAALPQLAPALLESPWALVALDAALMGLIWWMVRQRLLFALVPR